MCKYELLHGATKRILLLTYQCLSTLEHRAIQSRILREKRSSSRGYGFSIPLNISSCSHMSNRCYVSGTTNHRLRTRLRRRCMIAHLEQYVRPRHKCHADVLFHGKDSPERAGSSTKSEIFCSTTDLGKTGEGGRGDGKSCAGKQGHTAVALVRVSSLEGL